MHNVEILDEEQDDDDVIEQLATIDQLTQLLVAWYQRQIGLLTHLSNVPEGTEVQVGDAEEAEAFLLEGDVLKGYRLGLNMALSNISSLPFIMTPIVEESVKGQVAH